MPTTAEITQRYVQAHDDIANAITNKGGTVNTGDGFEDFATDIGSIPTPNIQPVTILSNGVYTVSGGVDGYSPVTVTVPNTYTQSDEGKVVNNGALVAQTATSTTTNGTIDTTLHNSINVNVPNTYTASDEGKVVDNGALVAQTAYPTTITSNNTYNTTLYNSIDVNVPNTYTLSDEGKVVDNGALVSQTATSITTNNTTVDTTLYNSVTVNIAVPQPTLITKQITTNGVYNASSDSADGYSSVDVQVPNTYTALDEGCVVNNGALVPQSSTSINTNGTYNTTLNNSVIVAVPNSYSASDEGKVVSNGALVSQTSTTITTNNTTVDTTLINSVSVAVSQNNTVYIVYSNTSFTNASSLRLFMETPTKLVIYGRGKIPKTTTSGVVACINTNIENVSPLLTGTHTIDLYKGATGSKVHTITLNGNSNVLSFTSASEGSTSDCWYGELNLS